MKALKKKKSGGRPLKFAERTRVYAVRIPESRYEELRRELSAIVHRRLLGAISSGDTQ